MRHVKALFAVLLFGLLMPRPAHLQEALIADLSKHLIAITTGFVGTDVLLFGAVDGADRGAENEGEVVVVVRGPPEQLTLRRKDRFALIWANAGSARFPIVPSYYAVAATSPLDRIASPSVLARHQIGVEHLSLAPSVTDSGADTAAYRRALVRLKVADGLYLDTVPRMDFLGSRLFRVDLHFPANVPVGTYSVEVYLFRDGEVVGAQTTPLVISKIGAGAEVYDFAHQQAAWYGVAAILLAVASGWLAAAAFRKS